LQLQQWSRQQSISLFFPSRPASRAIDRKSTPSYKQSGRDKREWGEGFAGYVRPDVERLVVDGEGGAQHLRERPLAAVVPKDVLVVPEVPRQRAVLNQSVPLPCLLLPLRALLLPRRRFLRHRRGHRQGGQDRGCAGVVRGAVKRRMALCAVAPSEYSPRAGRVSPSILFSLRPWVGEVSSLIKSGGGVRRRASQAGGGGFSLSAHRRVVPRVCQQALTCQANATGFGSSAVDLV
jgi:hypothetical protein